MHWKRSSHKDIGRSSKSVVKCGYYTTSVDLVWVGKSQSYRRFRKPYSMDVKKKGPGAKSGKETNEQHPENQPYVVFVTRTVHLQ